MNKAEKNKEEEAKKLEPEFETYKNSKEYKEIVEDLRKRDEDDEFRNDFDPQGYELYQKSVRKH
jgi:cytidylate kinase